MGRISWSHSNPGQLFTTDLIVSVVIFTVVLGIGFYALDTQRKNQFRFTEDEALREKTRNIADLMVRTGGHPSGWNNTTVKVIGFAPDNDHVLDNETLHQLNSTDSQLSYAEAKDVLDVEQAEFFLNISTETYEFTYGKQQDWKNLSNTVDDVFFQDRSVAVKDNAFFERGSLRLTVYTE